MSNIVITRKGIPCNTTRSVVIGVSNDAKEYNISLINNVIKNNPNILDKKGPHNVAVIGLPFVVVEWFNLKGVKEAGTKKFNMMKRRCVNLEDQPDEIRQSKLFDEADFFDHVNLFTQLNKYGISLWLGNSLGSIKQFNLSLVEGAVIEQRNIHTPMTINIGLSVAKAMNTQYNIRTDYIEAEYNGSDVRYPIYYGEAVTIKVDKAYGQFISDYLFNDNSIALEKKGEIHSNNVIDVRLVDIDFEGSKLVTKTTPLGADVRSTLYVNGNGTYEVAHKDFKHRHYDDETRVTNKYSQLINLGFTSKRKISTTKGSRTVEAMVYKSITHFKDSERVKMIETLTLTNQGYTSSADFINNLEKQLDWYITFNNNDGAYDWSSRNQIIRAYKLARRLGLIKPHRLRLIHEPEWARYYEDSDAGDDGEERSSREVSVTRELDSIESIIIKINDVDLESAAEQFKSQDYAEILVTVRE